MNLYILYMQVLWHLYSAHLRYVASPMKVLHTRYADTIFYSVWDPALYDEPWLWGYCPTLLEPWWLGILPQARWTMELGILRHPSWTMEVEKLPILHEIPWIPCRWGIIPPTMNHRVGILPNLPWTTEVGILPCPLWTIEVGILLHSLWTMEKGY